MKRKAFAIVSAILMTLVRAQITTTTPKAVPAFANQCMKCLLANAAYEYCGTSNVCFDRALPAGFGCSEVYRDIMQTSAC